MLKGFGRDNNLCSLLLFFKEEIPIDKETT